MTGGRLWGGRWSLVGLLAVALVLRVGLVAATGEHVPWGDPQQYDRHAVFLAEVGIYPPSQLAARDSPSAYRPPAWPYLLAGVYEVTGKRWTAGRLTAAVLGTLSVLLVYLIAQATFGLAASRWAGWLAAVFPPMALMSGSLAVESLFVFLMLAAVWATLAARASPQPLRWAALAGAAAGLAALTRPNGLVLLIPVAIGLAAAQGFRLKRPSVRSLAAPALALGVAVVCIAPWTIRNADAFGEFVPITTQGGYAMAQVWNAESASSDLARGAPHFGPVEPYLHRDGTDEVDVDRELRDFATDYARDHPRYAIELAGLNLLRLFKLAGHESFTHYWNLERDLNALRRAVDSVGLAIVVLLVLVALAYPRSRRRLRDAPWWLWLVPALLLASTVLLFGNPRHRAALDPFLVLVAGVALCSIAERYRNARPSPR